MLCKWIKDYKTCMEKELLNYLQVQIVDGLYLAYYTSSVVCGTYKDTVCTPPIADVNHLLELRVFNETSEFRAVRSDIGKAFLCRTADDLFFQTQLTGKDFEEQFKNRIFKEIHFLDIDSTRTKAAENGTTFFSTGGGEYTLPTTMDICKVQMQSYINYSEETGNALIVDWRVVKFLA